ncbi:NUDIX domain-containing protein [Patescibacteria group bacterium]
MYFFDADGNKVEYDGSDLEWRVSAYGLIYKKDKVFLIKHKHEKNYDLPGGGINLGEHTEDALIREAREEAGIELKVKKLISYKQDYFYYKQKKKYYQTILLFFECEIDGKKKKPSEKSIEFADFISIKDLKKYPLIYFVREVVDQYKNN